MKKLVPNLLTTVIVFVCIACCWYHAWVSSFIFVEGIEERNFLTDWNYYEDSKKVPCTLSMLKKYVDSGMHQQGELVVIHIPDELNLIGKKILTEFNEEKDHKNTLIVFNLHGFEVPDERTSGTKAKSYIIVLKAANELSVIIKKIKSHVSWNPTASFIVLFTEHMNEFRLMVQTKSVLQELFEHSVVDVNVISDRDRTSIIQSQTWYPYEGTNCGENVISVRTVNECEFFGQQSENETEVDFNEDTDEEQTGEDELFLLQYDFSNLGPKLPFNLHGCPIRVAALALEPFVIQKDAKNTIGFEVIMTKVISEQMNLVPIFKIMDSNIANKFITANNITGLYADIVNGKVDIMIGGMFDNNISTNLVSSSVGYSDDDLTWCVATARGAPTWMNVFAIFDMKTWAIAVILVFLTGLGLLWMLKYEGIRHENFMWSTFIALALSINVSAPYQPKSSYIRIFIAGYFLYGMNFSTAYQSFLISVLTRPRFQPQIKELKVAVQKEMIFVGPENVINYLHSDDPVTEYVRDNYFPCNDLDECLADLVGNTEKAVATSRQHAENNRVISNEDIFCFPGTENIHSYGVKLMVRRDFHLLPKFDDLIQRVSESGLFGKWYSEAKSFKISARANQEDVSADLAKPLQLKHLAGAYGLLFCGCTLSILSFITEWIIYYFSRYRNYRWARWIDEFCLSSFPSDKTCSRQIKNKIP